MNIRLTPLALLALGPTLGPQATQADTGTFYETRAPCAPDQITSGGFCLSNTANVPGVHYYVSPFGSDSNPGTSPSLPWQTADKAAAHSYSFGDRVDFLGGRDYAMTGCWTLTGGGNVTSNAASPFTVGSYGSGVATIHAGCSGAKQAALHLQSVQGFVLAGGVKFLPQTPGQQQYGILIDNPTASPSGNIVLNLAGTTAAPMGGFFTNSATDFGAEIFYAGYPGTGGLHDITINGGVLGGTSPTSPDDNGITGYGNGENITNFLVKGTIVQNIGGKAGGIPGSEGNGVLFNGVNGGNAANVFVQSFNANVNTCGAGAGLWTYNSNNVRISYSEVTGGDTKGCDGAGIDADGKSTNIEVDHNYVHDNAGAGMLLYDTGTWGPVLFHDNVLVNNASKGQNSIFWQFSQASSVFRAWHNTIVSGATATTSPSGFAIASGTCPGAGSFVADNLFWQQADANGFNHFIYNSPGQCPGLAFKGNAYWGTGRRHIWRDGGTILQTLAAWQAEVVGGDTGALQVDPLFSSAPAIPSPSVGSIVGPQPSPQGYTLQPSSPLRGAGFDLSSLGVSPGATDYFGNPKPVPSNIGAY